MRRLVLLLLCPLLYAEELPKVLFLTHSLGYEHAVVKRRKNGDLSLAERQLVEAAKGRYEIVATKDCGAVADLTPYAAVVFYTTGELPIARERLLDWVSDGGAFVGIHPATDTLYKFRRYGGMVGGYFNGHPWHQGVRIRVEDRAHPATAHLGEAFEIVDEIYQFRDWHRTGLHVLLSLDPESVDLTKKGVKRDDKDFGIAWCKPYGRGRVFYTALGHRAEVWKDDRFLKHVLGGLAWTLDTPKAPDRDDEGYRVLFDAEHTQGWKQAGPGSFTVKDGVATTVGGMGLWYYEGAQFRNFILKIEFRQNKIEANSGVFIRFPRVEADPWIPVREGYEIQIAKDVASKSNTGSIYSFQGPTKVPLKAAGEWNEFEITCIGQNYTVRLNGDLINEYVGNRALAGMIGMQNHQDYQDSVVSYRNVRVLELPDDATKYHVLDQAGWRMCGPGSFDRAGDVVTSVGGMGMLWHEKPFEDFLLLLDWKVGRKQDNAGVFVRFPDPGNDPWVAVNQGYELQICDTAEAKHRTGSVYSFQDASSVPTKAVGDWNHYAIEVRGQRYRLRVNGVAVNEFTGDRSLAGHIGLQNHDDHSRVSFRNIRVVELAK